MTKKDPGMVEHGARIPTKTKPSHKKPLMWSPKLIVNA
jgi:hypothetical protein